jgi:hypothetical protein
LSASHFEEPPDDARARVDAVFEKLATILMVEVWIPMVDGRWLVMPRHTQPEKDVQALLNQIRTTLPSQPPPRIKATQIPSKQATDRPSSVVKTYG